MSGKDIVRPPTPIQITPELPTATVFYSRVARNLVRSVKKVCGWHLITAIMRLSSHPYVQMNIKRLKKLTFCQNH